MVTGLDLVEWMIRVAAGEKLPFTTVPLNGHAIEVRVYAEDPSRNFLPALGRLTRLRPPTEREGIRLDTGVKEGSEISRYYDPMIAKLIAYGPDREAAIARMADALDEYEIQGVRHNLTFLAALIRHPRFASFDFSTAFLGTEYPHGICEWCIKRNAVGPRAGRSRNSASPAASRKPRLRHSR
jgi:propionyl-CoA carboxylase alpha chain